MAAKGTPPPEPVEEDVTVETETVSPESDAAPADETEDERYVRELGPHVHYAGREHERRITQQDFESAGVEDQGTLIWHADNGKRLPLEDISEGARQIIASEADFRFVE